MKTYAEFMVEIQNYFGPYPEKTESRIASYVNGYIRREYSEDHLGDLFRAVTYSHPVRFGPPCIADIEKAVKIAQSEGKAGISMVRKRQASAAEEGDDLPSDTEREQVARELAKVGGVSGLLKTILLEKSVRRREDVQAENDC